MVKKDLQIENPDQYAYYIQMTAPLETDSPAQAFASAQLFLRNLVSFERGRDGHLEKVGVALYLPSSEVTLTPSAVSGTRATWNKISLRLADTADLAEALRVKFLSDIAHQAGLPVATAALYTGNNGQVQIAHANPFGESGTIILVNTWDQDKVASFYAGQHPALSHTFGATAVLDSLSGNDSRRTSSILLSKRDANGMHGVALARLFGPVNYHTPETTPLAQQSVLDVLNGRAKAGAAHALTALTLLPEDSIRQAATRLMGIPGAESIWQPEQEANALLTRRAKLKDLLPNSLKPN